MNFFEHLFDFNHDGQSDTSESVARDSFVMHMRHEESKKEKLSDAGIDPDEFDYMSQDEKEEALADAGLDEDEFED